RYSGIDFLRFYGFGNETEITAPPEFYQITQRQVTAAASLTVFPPNSRISAGPFFALAETELGRGRLVDSLRPYGVEGFVEAGADARVEIDTRDRASAPRRGVHLVATGRLVPKGLDVTQPYGSVSGEATTYLSVGDPARVTLALRAGGKQVWGRYPFHAAAYVGGARTLRGYNEQRFAGDAVAYGNGEVRLFLTKVSVLLPGELGVLGLGDVGRAYLAGERSGRWHGSVGGGVWLALIERGSAVTLTVARSPERWAFYGGLGFMF
ncbi:MAG: BamA/TamA family outer membrane protein, partial [Gemmatimonadetes bacterium]|nr:BamA/TamA family outer membrane protein [Gemmatimonadota bacterium]